MAQMCSYYTGKREFTLIPTMGSQHTLDPTFHLFTQAYTRGLFKKPLEELLHGDELFLETQMNINDQPVLLQASPQTGRLTESAMKESALNVKLKEICRLVGLYKHNTIYSLRRTALTEIKRHYGADTARELAAHVRGSDALSAYVQRGEAEKDITAMRLQEFGMTQTEISKMFSQAMIGKFIAADSDETLIEVLRSRTEDAARSDEEWQALDQELEV